MLLVWYLRCQPQPVTFNLNCFFIVFEFGVLYGRFSVFGALSFIVGKNLHHIENIYLLFVDFCILENKKNYKVLLLLLFFKYLGLIQSCDLVFNCVSVKYGTCVVVCLGNSRKVEFRFVFGNKKKNKCIRSYI